MIKNVSILLLSMLGTLLFAALFIFLFANSTSMTCQRQPDGSFRCLIQKRLFGQLTTSTRVVNGVNQARTEESCDNDGCSYRTELVSAGGGSTPFNDVYTDNGPTVQTTDRINAYLRQGNSSFSMDEPVQLWVLFLIGGLGLMGLAIEAIMIFAQLFKAFTRRS